MPKVADLRDYPGGRKAVQMEAFEVTLDGTNPTPIVTGMKEIVFAVASYKRSDAPALDPHLVTLDYGGSVAAGTVNVHAWKPTGAADVTMIASTDSTEVVTVLVVGR